MTSALDKSGIAEMTEAINDFIIEDLEKGDQEVEEDADANALSAVPRRRCC
jgi:hypothetical protein